MFPLSLQVKIFFYNLAFQKRLIIPHLFSYFQCFLPIFPLPSHNIQIFIETDGAEPHSSVGSVADLRTGGRRFDTRLGQYSFRGLMTVIATGYIPLLLLYVILLCWKANSGLERILCKVLVKRTPGKHE